MFNKPTNEVTPMAKTTQRKDVFVVESHVPVPPIKTGRRSSKYDFMKDMTVGQSFVVADHRQAQRVYAAAKKMGVGIITRKTDEGVRIWRK